MAWMSGKDMVPEPIEDQEIQERETTANRLADEERFTEPEWLEWFALTPQPRWAESERSPSRVERAPFRRATPTEARHPFTPAKAHARLKASRSGGANRSRT